MLIAAPGRHEACCLVLAKRNFALYVAALNISTRQALCAVTEMSRI
jgi:hypothetical protein